MLKKYKNKLIEGYTIIETMIAISIFLIVIVIGIGSLLNANIINKKSQNTRSIVDGLSFTMEDMSRNIRMGYDYKCLEKGNNYTQADLGIPKSCADGYGIAFEHGDGGVVGDNSDQWIYYIQNGKIFRSTNGLTDSVQMTPDEVTIDEKGFNFSVLGAEKFSTGDTQQPLVIIRINGQITSGGNSTPFSLQTAVSQRLSDI